MKIIGGILVSILGLTLWAVCMVTVILVGVYVIKIGLQELFEIDALAPWRDWIQSKFAPLTSKAFISPNETLYVGIPKNTIEEAVKAREEQKKGNEQNG